MGSSIGDVYVPPTGPRNARIMLVGEAPGADEVVEGEPFVGASGQFLTRYLGRVGVKRSDVFLTNLCRYKPAGNKFEIILKSPELAAGLEELKAEIEEIKPNLIVALGAWPMWYLTGCTASKGKAGTGIMNWRGSTVPCTLVEGYKVLCTLHPAYIIRPTGFDMHPVFLNDLRKIKREAGSCELNEPKFIRHIDPDYIWDLVDEMSQAEWMSVDIETFGDSLACVGFADSIDRALCVTFENHHGWGPARKLLNSPAKKIFQFGAFDINYLWWYYKWGVENYAFDTYIAAANLLPEFKRGLDFLNSIYTPLPFYKEERKVWKKTGDMTTYWHYNLKDCISEYWIAMEQMQELTDLYGQV